MMSWLGELLEYSKSGQRDERLQEVCVSLRRLGFSNRELSDFSGGVFPTPSINRWSAGVKVMSGGEKEELMSELRSFVEGGHKVGDIEACKRADSMLRDKSLNFESCVKLVEELNSVESTPEDLHCLALQLRDNGLLVADVKKGIQLQSDLAQAGLTHSLQQQLLRASEKYGPPEMVLKMVNDANDAAEFTRLKISETQQIKALQAEKTRVETEIKRIEASTLNLSADIALAKTLREKHYFDQSSMNELQDAAEKLGTVTGVIAAVNAYSDLRRIKAEVSEAEATKRTLESEIGGLKAERGQIQSTIAEISRQQGAVEQLTRSMRYVMVLAELIMRPRDTTADDKELARISVALLNGLQERAVSANLDPKLKLIIRGDVSNTVRSLQEYLRYAP